MVETGKLRTGMVFGTRPTSRSDKGWMRGEAGALRLSQLDQTCAGENDKRKAPASPAQPPLVATRERSSSLKNRSYAPIGVFDSGAGGLTILSALRQELPQEHYIYFGDTAHIPYGMRTESNITTLTVKACRFLIEQGVKLIVVGCNTASQAALQTLRATFSLPFVGVVPAVKPAARMTQNGRIGIAATNQAAQSPYLQGLIQDFAQGVQAYPIGCSELVTLVERGELAGPEVEQTLRRVLAPLLEQDIDVLVLGCTHFPVLRSPIERVVGEHVRVIDSAAAIARRTRTILTDGNALHPSNDASERDRLQVWCSGDAKHFSSVASAILGYPVVASQAKL